MVVSYWYSGAWRTYASAADIRRGMEDGSFSYIPQGGSQRLVAKGKIVSVQTIAKYGATPLPNAMYYERIGTVGPKIFALNDGTGSDANFTYTGPSSAKINPPEVRVVESAPVVKKAGINPLALVLVAAAIAWVVWRKK